jgi:hypothetical protein
MKKLLIGLFLFMGLFLFSPNAFALTWYWGDNSAVDYTATYPGTEKAVFIPFTIEADNKLFNGASGWSAYLNGATGSDYKMSASLNGYYSDQVGVYNGTASIPYGFSLQRVGVEDLPDGIYTTNDLTALHYWIPDAPDNTPATLAYALNTFSIQVGDAPQNNAVPEPATLLLFGTGLTGFGFFKKRKN